LGKVGGQVETIIMQEPLAQGVPVAGRRAASDDQVGQRSQGEDVKADPVRFGPPDSFWSLKCLSLAPVDVYLILISQGLISRKGLIDALGVP
jgi:hypothetical protein